MIVSASYRTDIPAFYGEWFLNRLDAGYCRARNPYGGQLYRIGLTRREVEGFVFWTRNLGPFMDALGEVRRRGFPFLVQYTVNGYPRVLDQATVDPGLAVGHLAEVVRAFGARVPVWRYDPLVITTSTPAPWHLANFARLASALAGAVDEVVVSFAQVYRKTARNMAAAARAHGFDWRDPGDDEKRELLAGLAAIAADHGMTPTLCGQPALLGPGIEEARCIDARRLGEVAGEAITAAARPHRKDCGCFASRDIGEYDTCPHGCVYCYAVNNRALAKRRFSRHDAAGEFLLPPAPADDG